MCVCVCLSLEKRRRCCPKHESRGCPAGFFSRDCAAGGDAARIFTELRSPAKKSKGGEIEEDRCRLEKSSVVPRGNRLHLRNSALWFYPPMQSGLSRRRRISALFLQPRHGFREQTWRLVFQRWKRGTKKKIFKRKTKNSANRAVSAVHIWSLQMETLYASHPHADTDDNPPGVSGKPKPWASERHLKTRLIGTIVFL